MPLGHADLSIARKTNKRNWLPHAAGQRVSHRFFPSSAVFGTNICRRSPSQAEKPMGVGVRSLTHSPRPAIALSISTCSNGNRSRLGEGVWHETTGEKTLGSP